MDSSIQPFRLRRTRLLGEREIAGWRLKIYGIVADGSDLPDNLLDAALAHAECNVPWPQEHQWRFGFLTIHVGEQAVWLLVDIWTADILRHFLFRAPVGSNAFVPGPTDGTTACVWELQVIQHERDAWVRHVLRSPMDADFEAWACDAFTIESS